MNIFPEDQVDENFFDIYYHPFKKQIWGLGLLLTIAVVSFLGIRQYRQQRLDDQWTRYEDAMALRTATLPGQADATEVSAQASALQTLADEFPDEAIAPFALRGVVQARVAGGELDAALDALTALEARYPDFAMNSLPADGADGTTSLSDHLRSTIESEKEWRQSTEYVHPAPSESRMAIIDTNMGTLTIGFYDDAAPQHVAAFIERAKRGDYNGTQFYEVRLATDGSPQLVRGGSAASKTERYPALHDRDEPADTIELEDSRFTIRHQFGVISAVDMDSGESATNFQIVTAENGMTRFDGRNSPFAAILDRPGTMEALGRIGRAPTYGTSPDTAGGDGVFRMRDHPYPPVIIRRIAILTNEKIEDGHSWDTARVASDEPEAWEAELPPPPTPDEFAAPSENPDEVKPGDGTETPDDRGGDGSDADEAADEPGPDDATDDPADE